MNLRDSVRELLKLFYKTCARKPDRILFLRDGVSEGMFKEVSGTRQPLYVHLLS